METSRKFAEEKRKKNQMGKGACCKVLFSLFGVVKNPVIYDDPTPLSSFQYPSSIQSLILALFDSVLGKKKILRISPANLGKKIILAAGIPAFTLDIQTGIS
jgi:hypothetical protein